MGLGVKVAAQLNDWFKWESGKKPVLGSSLAGIVDGFDWNGAWDLFEPELTHVNWEESGC